MIDNGGVRTPLYYCNINVITNVFTFVRKDDTMMDERKILNFIEKQFKKLAVLKKDNPAGKYYYEGKEDAYKTIKRLLEGDNKS